MPSAYEAWVDDARAVRVEDEIRRRGIRLSQHATEPKGPCPVCGGEDRFAIRTDKQRFFCRRSGAGGDVIAMVEYLDGCDFKAAVETLTGRAPPSGERGRISPEAIAERAAAREEAERLRAAAEQAAHEAQEAAGKRAEKMWAAAGPASDAHPYLAGKGLRACEQIRQSDGHLIVPLRDFSGRLWNVQRIAENGDKLFLKDSRKRGCFSTLVTPGDKNRSEIRIGEGWATCKSVFDSVGGVVLVAFDAANLVPVAEGARQKYPDARITICADNDTETDGNPGLKWGQKAADACGGALVYPPNGGDFDDLRQSAGLDEVRRVLLGEPARLEPPRDEPFHIDPPPPPPEPILRPQSPPEWPFRVLGYNGGEYYYFSRAQKQLTALRAEQHTTARLLGLAPLDFWLANFTDGKPKLDDASVSFITDQLIRMCELRGLFSPDHRRGRGAWIDDGRVIVHTGPTASVNGIRTELSEIRSKFLYEAADDWEFGDAAPAADQEARELASLCSMPTWENPISGRLLAGWLVIAHVCGAISWRPHLWLTGSSGSGKSTIQKDIIERFLGPAALKFDSSQTTEAAIRQTLGLDARPIIIDEIESEDKNTALKVQAVLQLARVSSSGGKVQKGTVSHKSVSFTVRSCFCFSSINTSVRHRADETRISKLVLKKNDAPDARQHYNSLVSRINRVLTPEFSARMFARTVRYLPTLNRNIETFTQAAAVVFKDRRAADQLGAMLAGYYLCFKTSEISEEDARKFLTEREWGEHIALDQNGDETRLLAHIMTSRMRVGMEELTLGQAILIAQTPGEDKWNRALGAEGIKVGYCGARRVPDTSRFTIASSSPNLRRRLDGTPWENGWDRPLRNLDGALKSETITFTPGLRSGGVSLPISVLSVVSEARPVDTGDVVNESVEDENEF